MASIKPLGFPIERGKVHEFANALRAEDPMHHSVEAAQAAGLPSVVAPPTFTAAAAFFPDDSPRDSPLEGLDMRFLLHGGQEIVYERPIFAGDLLTAEAGETRSWEKEGKRGGKMKFVETEVLYRDADGELVVRIKNTLIQTAGTVEE